MRVWLKQSNPVRNRNIRVSWQSRDCNLLVPKPSTQSTSPGTGRSTTKDHPSPVSLAFRRGRRRDGSREREKEGSGRLAVSRGEITYSRESCFSTETSVPGNSGGLMDSRKPFHLVEIMTARSFLGTRLRRTVSQRCRASGPSGRRMAPGKI